MHLKRFGEAVRTSRDSPNGSATKARARPAHEPSAPPDLAALTSQSTTTASPALPFCAQDAHTPSPCHLSSTPTERCSWASLVGHARGWFRHPQCSSRPLRPTNRGLLTADPRAARERAWGRPHPTFPCMGGAMELTVLSCQGWSCAAGSNGRGRSQPPSVVFFPLLVSQCICIVSVVRSGDTPSEPFASRV